MCTFTDIINPERLISVTLLKKIGADQNETEIPVNNVIKGKVKSRIGEPTTTEFTIWVKNLPCGVSPEPCDRLTDNESCTWTITGTDYTEGNKEGWESQYRLYCQIL